MPREGLRQRVLGLPRAYELFQSLVGAPRSKAHFVTDHVRAIPGDRILDLGCGTGAMLKLRPSGITYVGVDVDPGYIDRAKTKFDRGTFVCADITRYEPPSEFDAVIAYGVLHHLDDDGTRAALGAARRALAADGRALFAEPCRTDEQGWFEKTIMNLDRGRHIRTAARYVELMKERFAGASTDEATAGYRIPYTLVIFRATI